MSQLELDDHELNEVNPGQLRPLLRLILGRPGPLVAGAVLMVTATGAALLEPRLFGYAIDEAIVPKDWDRLQAVTLVFFGVILARVLSVIGQSYYFEKLGQGVAQDLRCRLFSHLQRLPVSVFDKNPAGRLMTRVTNDISSVSEMFSAGFVALVGNALLVFGILVWLLVLNWRLGLIAMALFPLMAALTVYFSRKLKVSYRDARSKLSALNSFLAENFLGMRIIHLFNRQAAQFGRLDQINNDFARAQTNAVRVFALFQPSITVISGVSTALVIWFGVLSVREGSLAPGIFVAFLAYVLTLFQPLREMADKWNIFLSGMASAERVFSILDWPVELPEGAEKPALPVQSLRGEIRFEDVWFAYEGEKWVLREFNLTIRAGSRVGIVGHTGAGKTTLISLIMRFYEPQRGRILLDGVDIREYDRRSLRASIGIVQQDVFLFSGSRSDNVDFWASSARLQGNDGEISERGLSLSAGERQVVAFERAKAANPAIWILDEATSNVDSGTEAMIQRELEACSSGRTAILIAHRLATVRNASNIVVLHKGQLLEQGSHAELMDLDGLYARLYRYQKARAASDAREAHDYQGSQRV